MVPRSGEHEDPVGVLLQRAGLSEVPESGAVGVVARHPKAKRIALDFKVTIDAREDSRVVPFWQGVEFLVEKNEMVTEV